MFELLRSLRINDDATRATGVAHIGANHPFFADHFPGHPILPGSMALELAAQVAGPLAEEAVARLHPGDRYAFLGMVRDAKFLHPIQLPTNLRFEARIIRSDAARVAVRVTAYAEETTVLRGELMLAMAEPTAEWETAIEQRRQRVARWRQAAAESPP